MVRGFEQFDVLARALARVWRAEYIAGYGNRIRAGSDHFGRAVQSDAPDGHNWFIGERTNPPNEIDANDRIGVGFGRSAKHGASRDVIGGCSGGAFELLQVVRGDADPFAFSNHLPGGLGGQILLAHMNASGVHYGGDIGAIVYQKPDALGNQSGGEPAGGFEEFARR